MDISCLVDKLVVRASPSKDFLSTAKLIADSYVTELKRSTKEDFGLDSFLVDDLGIDSLDNVEIMLFVEDDTDVSGDYDEFVVDHNVSTVYSNFYSLCKAASQSCFEPAVFDPLIEVYTHVLKHCNVKNYDKAVSVAKKVVSIVPLNGRSVDFSIDSLDLDKESFVKLNGRVVEELGVYLLNPKLLEQSMASLAFKAYNR